MTFTHSIENHGNVTTARESFLIYLPFSFAGTGRNIKLEDNAWFACFSADDTAGEVAARSPANMQTHDLVGPAVNTTIRITQATKQSEFLIPSCGDYSFGEVFRLRPPNLPPPNNNNIAFFDLANWNPGYQAPQGNPAGNPFRQQNAALDGGGGMPFLYNLSPVVNAQGLTSTLGLAGPFQSGGFLEKVHNAGAGVAMKTANASHPSFTVADGGTLTAVFAPGGGSGKGSGYVLVLGGDFAPSYSKHVKYLFWKGVFDGVAGNANTLAEHLRDYVDENRRRRLTAIQQIGSNTAYHPGYDVPCELYYVEGLNGLRTPRIGRPAP